MPGGITSSWPFSFSLLRNIKYVDPIQMVGGYAKPETIKMAGNYEKRDDNIRMRSCCTRTNTCSMATYSKFNSS